MQFSSASDKQGICERIDFFCNSDTGSYPLADKAANVNNWLDYITSTILASDNRWQWDDINNTSTPIGTLNLTDSIQDYRMDLVTTGFLRILRVEVMDSNGNYNLVTPIDMRDINDQAMSEFQKTPGMPLYYDKNGNYMSLYPKPSSSNVTLTAGLKIYFQRTATYFTSGDTTKSPGFAAPFHRLLVYGPVIDYMVQNDFPENKISRFERDFGSLEQKLIEFYQKRNRDEDLTMSLRSEDYGIGGTRRPNDYKSIN